MQGTWVGYCSTEFTSGQLWGSIPSSAPHIPASSAKALTTCLRLSGGVTGRVGGVSSRIPLVQMGSFPSSALGGKETGEAQGRNRWAQGAELELEPRFALACSGHLGHAMCHRAHSPADMEGAGRAPYKTRHGIPKKDSDPATAHGHLVPLLSVIRASESGWSRRSRRAEGDQWPEFGDRRWLTSPRHPDPVLSGALSVSFSQFGCDHLEAACEKSLARIQRWGDGDHKNAPSSPQGRHRATG